MLPLHSVPQADLERSLDRAFRVQSLRLTTQNDRTIEQTLEGGVVNKLPERRLPYSIDLGCRISICVYIKAEINLLRRSLLNRKVFLDNAGRSALG